MKRRLTKLTAAGLAVLALTGCTGGVPEEVSEEPPVPKNVETTWTLVVGQPEGSTCWDAAESFAEALSDATEGAVAVEVQPMPLDRVTSLEQAAAGIVDLYLDSSFVYGSYGDEEELGRPFFSVTMPFLFPDAETAAEVYSGEFDAVTWVPVSKKRLRKRGVRSGPVPDRQHVRGLARDAAGDAAQGAGQPAPVRHRRSGGASGQRAGRLRGGIAGAVRRKAFAAGGRYLHHRRYTGRVRPCLEGGRRGGRDVPDIGHGAGVKR